MPRQVLTPGQALKLLADAVEGGPADLGRGVALLGVVSAEGAPVCGNGVRRRCATRPPSSCAVLTGAATGANVQAPVAGWQDQRAGARARQALAFQLGSPRCGLTERAFRLLGGASRCQS